MISKARLKRAEKAASKVYGGGIELEMKDGNIVRYRSGLFSFIDKYGIGKIARVVRRKIEADNLTKALHAYEDDVITGKAKTLQDIAAEMERERE